MAPKLARRIYSAATRCAGDSPAKEKRLKLRFNAGKIATSIVPIDGSMMIIATVAERLSESFRRGGRHTEKGVPKSSNRAVLTCSGVAAPKCGNIRSRTRMSRYREQGVLATPVSRSFAKATGLTK